jgi:ACR3 family arsenite transporter
MVLGVSIGYIFPSVYQMINGFSYGSTNIPLAIGLIIMMYPPLAKVDFSKLFIILKDIKSFTLSMIMIWLIAPLLMFILANLFLSNYPDLVTGLIIIGIAPCIAMVIVWSDLSGGNREYTAGLVAINAIIQLLFFSVMAYFYLDILPHWLNIKVSSAEIPFKEVATSVLIYLGIPFFGALISRIIMIKIKGIQWFNGQYLRVISPLTLIALLLTIVLMFSLKGAMMIALPKMVFMVAIPLVIFFCVMFFITFFIAISSKIELDKAVSIAFTSSGNNFELAIAVSIAVFGLESSQAFAAVIGPLVEVPVLLSLVIFVKWYRKR